MEEDLYGDLDTSTRALVNTEVKQENERVQKENEKLRFELAVLQQQNRLLGERTQALETNISTLFVTAQHEIKRKDAEIQRLRQTLAGKERLKEVAREPSERDRRDPRQIQKNSRSPPRLRSPHGPTRHQR